MLINTSFHLISEKYLRDIRVTLNSNKISKTVLTEAQNLYIFL